MSNLEVGFCSECCEEIISNRLSIFWKCTCMSIVTDGKWISFKETDRLAMKYIKALENKKFIVSTDHGDEILIKPHGVYEREDRTFLVCLCPTKHFENIST